MKIEILKNKNSKDFILWPIWKCEKSEFHWTYDQEEHCFIIEGSVTVFYEGDTVDIGYNPDIGQKAYLKEDARTISTVTSTDIGPSTIVAISRISDL